MDRFRSLLFCCLVGLVCGCSGTSTKLTPAPTAPPSTSPSAPASASPTSPASTTPTSPASTSPTTPASTSPTAPASTAPTAPATSVPTPTPPSPTPTATATVYQYYFCVGVDGLTPAETSMPANPFPIPHIASPCVPITFGAATNDALAVSNESGTPAEASVTCFGPCVLRPTTPALLTAVVQVVSVPSGAPQLTGVSYNIEANAAHALGLAAIATPCASLSPNPYSLSGGGQSFTIDQSQMVAGTPNCSVDIYDQYGDYAYIQLTASSD